MRLFIELSCALLVVVPSGAATLTDAQNVTNNVDLFLQSCNIDPLKLDDTAKKVGSTTLACAIFEVLWNGETIAAANSSIYTIEREAHWSSTAWEFPSCIYTPANTQDVVFAVKVLGFTKSKYAIRSGGHSPLADWASIDDGVLISMANISNMAYDASAETVLVGFGRRWGELYELLESFDRLVVGGRVPSVGLALTIGGGLSHLSNQYGFSADNVVSFEVVLANATLVVADAFSHSDLFWALKGGSNNFGIVTHMTLRTYSAGRVWGGTLIYNSSFQDDLMSAFATYQEVGQLDTKSALITDMGINNDTLILTLVYFGSVERPAAFRPFFEIPARLDLTRLHNNFTDLVNQQANQVVPRWTWGMTNLYLDKKTYVDVARICKEETTYLAGVNGATMVLLPQPISRTMIEASQQTMGNAMSLSCVPQLWFTINIGWNFQSDDAKVHSVLHKALDKIETMTKARDLYDPFIFLNDAYSTQPVLRSYGATHFQRLNAVSKAYDATGMFQHQVPGGFKLR